MLVTGTRTQSANSSFSSQDTLLHQMTWDTLKHTSSAEDIPPNMMLCGTLGRSSSVADTVSVTDDMDVARMEDFLPSTPPTPHKQKCSITRSTSQSSSVRKTLIFNRSIKGICRVRRRIKHYRGSRSTGRHQMRLRSGRPCRFRYTLSTVNKDT